MTIPVTYLGQEYIVKLIEQIPTKSSQDSAKVQLQKQVDIQPSEGNDGSIQHSCLNVKTCRILFHRSLSRVLLTLWRDLQYVHHANRWSFGKQDIECSSRVWRAKKSAHYCAQLWQFEILQHVVLLAIRQQSCQDAKTLRTSRMLGYLLAQQEIL